MQYQKILDKINKQFHGQPIMGEVASYIPELAKVAADKLGMHLCSLNSGNYCFGDNTERLSIQSISKVLSLTLAYLYEGDDIWKRVAVEPSGNPFNSLIQLEHENGIPRNPLINAGALVICDLLITHLKNPKEDYLNFIRKISGNSTIDYNLKVAASEAQFGHRNAALINFMKSFGNIHNNIRTILDFYFHTCAIEMSCQELAQTFLIYANGGALLDTGEQIISNRQTKRINAIMQTCGFYDEAGEFAFRVGLPGKSGVGGGIVAVHPGYYSVAVWSPPLNKKGNSVLGIQALESLTTLTGLSIF